MEDVYHQDEEFMSSKGYGSPYKNAKNNLEQKNNNAQL